MASILSSARSSSVSIFSAVGTLADQVTGSLQALGYTIESLNVKAKDFRDDSVRDSVLHRVFSDDMALADMVTEYVDAMEEHHRKNFPSKQFDRDAIYKLASDRFTKALAERKSA